MPSAFLHRLFVQVGVEDLRRRGAARRWATGQQTHLWQVPAECDVTLRFAFPDDASALARLAVLDSAEPPPRPVLLAEVAGELRAALSLSDRSVVADPFHPTIALVELLRARARQLSEAGGRPDGTRATRGWAPFGVARPRPGGWSR